MFRDIPNGFWAPRQFLIIGLIAGIYLAISSILIGFKTDQLVLTGIFAVGHFAGPVSRRFILGFSIFIVYWIIFDYMKAFPNYRFHSVHLEDLYQAEKAAFGFLHEGQRITPNEYWLLKHQNGLDLLTGFFYLCWVPVPLAFAGWLFFTDKKRFLNFSITFVFVNLIGFVFYYIYPAAPPWYYQLHGSEFIAGTPGNTAGLSRFDAITGTSIFHGLYAKSSNVFAAMPSLHSAYPLIVVYYAFRKPSGWLFRFFAIAVMIGIWFSAVYTSHHYVLDVLAGICCAVIGMLIYNFWIMKLKWFQRFLNYYEQVISPIRPPQIH